jgi:glycerol-3-phosphate dehydrogenase
MPREQALERLERGGPFDLAIVGGGATGLGVAVDAAARGYSVALVESHDFGAGTSSRATKLVHGGVRYLAQGRVAFVREALQERAHLLHNAPHLVQPLAFVMPSYRLWETPFHGAGLKAYDVLAGPLGLGATRLLGAGEVLRRLPTLRASGLKGGVLYWDGQFDDARLALALARTAERHGAAVLNHCAATGLLHEGAGLAGLVCRDAGSGREFPLRAGCVVNATGVWVDALRALDTPPEGAEPLVSPSQGVHAVVDREFLPGRDALIVPRTGDGRVLFAVPWLGKVILGTTDTPRQDLPREPQPLPGELDFILRESGRYLSRAPQRQDIRSLWVGLRPLVRSSAGPAGGTAAASREHAIEISRSGLVTVTGGKWTTYRAMAEDVLQRCATAGLLRPTSAGVTARLRLVGADIPADPAASLAAPPGLHLYGSEAPAVLALPGAGRMLGAGLTEAMVRYAVRHEWARTVEDMLARRWRLLFLDAREAARLAPPVAEILAEESGADPQLGAFERLAESYLPAATG